jgi:flavodoxin
MVATSAVAGAGLLSCSTTTPRPDGTASRTQPTETGSTVRGSNVLLAYFSRAGENYYYGGRKTLDVGNTEVLANLISQRVDCDVYRIEAADPYSDDYDDTVARNVREQNADARPVIAKALPSVERYDTIVLGSPIWNVCPPMIMSTFVEGLDFSGKTVLPFTTYAMSGLGTAPRDYARLAPAATIGDGLAVQGEEARDAEVDVQKWLRAVRLLQD